MKEINPETIFPKEGETGNMRLIHPRREPVTAPTDKATSQEKEKIRNKGKIIGGIETIGGKTKGEQKGGRIKGIRKANRKDRLKVRMSSSDSKPQIMVRNMFGKKKEQEKDK